MTSRADIGIRNMRTAFIIQEHVVLWRRSQSTLVFSHCADLFEFRMHAESYDSSCVIAMVYCRGAPALDALLIHLRNADIDFLPVVLSPFFLPILYKHRLGNTGRLQMAHVIDMEYNTARIFGY